MYRGSFGTVCKAVRKSDNHEVAIKIVSKKKLNSKPGSNLMKYLEREVNILKSIKHVCNFNIILIEIN